MADLILSRLRRTLQNWFTTKIGFEGSEQASQPTQPASGYRQLYAKSDGWYDQDDGGVETKIGAGGTGLPYTFEATAGETLAENDVCYANASDAGEYWIATNDGTSAQADASAICVESGGIASASTGTFLRIGPHTITDLNLTPGAQAYLGTSGAIVDALPSAGNYAKPLGEIDSTGDGLFFDPQNGWLVGYDIDLTEIPAENDGRITLVSTTQIKWDGHRVTLWDPTKGRDVQVIPSSVPTLDYNDTDLDSNALVAAYPYDLFLEYSSATACTIVAKKWTNATTRAVSPALWHGRYRYDNTTDAGKKRLWIGTVYLDTGPVFKDEETARFISNVYNEQALILKANNPYTSLTSDTAASETYEGWNSSDTIFKIQLVLCMPRSISLTATALSSALSSYAIKVGIGLDANNASSAYFNSGYNDPGAVQSWGLSLAEYIGAPSAGYHYFLPLQAQIGSGSAQVIYFWTATAGKCATCHGRIVP